MVIDRILIYFDSLIPPINEEFDFLSPRIILRIYLHEIEMLLYKKQSILLSFFAFENARELADALHAVAGVEASFRRAMNRI